MADKSWKAFERRCARLLGTARIPVTGLDRNGADCETEALAVQCKLRRGMPVYLLEWLAGIREAARRRGKAGVVIWKQPRQRDEDALVVMRLADFAALVGQAAEPSDESSG